MPRKTDKPKETEEPEEGALALAEAMTAMIEPTPDLRTMMLYGEVEEEKIQELIVALLIMTEGATAKAYNEDGKLNPIRFFISTYGGAADDMFALYDIIHLAKRSCEIHTVGIGKVMSAGVLLLASGTKGKRFISKNCRIMIHSVQAGAGGGMHDLENEMKAIKNLQDVYINSLVVETCLTKRQLTKILDRKVNVYLTAEEAIEYGIADEIL
jgi:ATP-dependent Clp protease protease subunit